MSAQVFECVFAQGARMVGDIARPCLREIVKPLLGSPEESARRLFEMRTIASHGGEKAICPLLHAAAMIATMLIARGFFDELAQGDRGAARLAGEPGPVAGQERDLAGNDAQFRPTGATPRSLARARGAQREFGAFLDVGEAAAKIDLDRA